MKTLHTDCLVIGAGLAGSAYALLAAKAGLAVELLSLGWPKIQFRYLLCILASLHGRRRVLDRGFCLSHLELTRPVI